MLTQNLRGMIMRHCPICGEKRVAVIRQLHMVIPDEHKIQPRFAVVSCENCGFVFNDCDYNEGVDEAYSELTGTHGDYLTITPDERHLNEKTIEFLERNRALRPGVRIADMGCSYGILLRLLSQRGYTSLSGLDLDVNAVKFLAGIGFSMHRGSVASDYSAMFGEKFDLIILRHIVEHLHSPKEVIERVASSLNKDGMLLIEVPNLALYQCTAPFPGYFVEEYHINHFSKNSLLNLMKDWVTIDLEESPYIYPTLRGLFTPGNSAGREIVFSQKDREDIMETLDNPNSDGKALLDKIENLKGKKLALWGVSVFVHRLLTHTALKDCDIEFFVDRSPDIHGKKMLGKTIQSPEYLKEFTGTIVISGKGSQQSILQAIHQLGLTNEVVCLQGDLP